jgi:proteic killer suppression protein
VIKSIKHRETGKVLHREFSRRLPIDIQQIAYRKLRMLNDARSIVDLPVPPLNHLEKLKGDRERQYTASASMSGGGLASSGGPMMYTKWRSFIIIR